MEFLKFHNYLMKGLGLIWRHFWAWLSLTNAPKVPENKYQAGFGVIILGQNPQTFMIPIYSTTVLYDTLALEICGKNIFAVKKVHLRTTSNW